MDDVRPSPIAGRWYPAEAKALRQVVDGYLEAAPPLAAPAADEILGLLAPHAGLMFSGAGGGPCVPGGAWRAGGPGGARVPQPLSRRWAGADHRPPGLRHAAGRCDGGQRGGERGAGGAGGPAGPAARARAGSHSRRHRSTPSRSSCRFCSAPWPGISACCRSCCATRARRWRWRWASPGRGAGGRRALLVASSDLSHYFPQPRAEH